MARCGDPSVGGADDNGTIFRNAVQAQQLQRRGGGNGLDDQMVIGADVKVVIARAGQGKQLPAGRGLPKMEIVAPIVAEEFRPRAIEGAAETIRSVTYQC